ncbi:P-loop containing nucleoside triphosphate hydrolase protein [Testicularia cyperi]|uniref:DNA helicase n=1 Tax=Testicularia cyperi TaxID=1882483 RepID=A0A317XYB9_9BASI|nr:P-loop containing nucleoside triphosphate hydrolase protein [Testicularia cyperi]
MPPDINPPQSPSSAVLKQWLQRQLQLLEQEREEELSQSRLLLSKTAPKVLERNGLALLGLGVASVRIGLGAKLLVELERPSAFHASPAFPPHTFRPGDLASIVDHNAEPSKSGDGIQGVVYRTSDTKIIIAVGDRKKDRAPKDVGKDKRDAKTGDSTRVSGEELELPERVRLVKVANEATFDRMVNALERLARLLGVDLDGKQSQATSGDSSEDEPSASGIGSSSGPASATPLVRTLFGLSTPTWQNRDLPVAPFNSALNRTQLDAIRFALSSTHFSLIHGPPGTGKTTAIVELIMQIVASDFGAPTSQSRAVRVLVCGASNLAVDNILERLVGRPEHRELFKKKGVGVTRIGHPARVLSGLYGSTLDAQCTSSSEGQLVSDVGREINNLMNELKPPPSESKAGNKSARRAPRLKGAERRKKWDEVKELRKEYRRRERQVSNSVLDRAQVVLATCHGAGGKQLHGRQFDWVIIDEACQALEAACWVPILKARETGRLVLAGDHLQLPPTVKSIVSKAHATSKTKQKVSTKAQADSKDKTPQNDDTDTSTTKGTEEAGEQEEDDGTLGESFQKLSVRKSDHPPTRRLRPAKSLETTLFSRLLGMYGPEIKSLLAIQYRMCREIMDFPNHELYEGKLEAHDSCAEIRLSDLSNFAADHNGGDDGDDEELFAPVVFYDTAGCEFHESVPESDDRGPSLLSDSKSNIHEVEIVMKHLRLLFSGGVTADQVTILAPYSAQVSLLASVLKSSTFSGTEGTTVQGEDIELGTVDSMQGREKDVVILSLVRSNEQAEVGFLAQKKRLNVAITRAKRQLVVIGDAETVGSAKDLPDGFLPNYMAWLDQNAAVESVVATL